MAAILIFKCTEGAGGGDYSSRGRGEEDASETTNQTTHQTKISWLRTHHILLTTFCNFPSIQNNPRLQDFPVTTWRDARSQGLSFFRPLVAMGTEFPVPWALFRSHIFDVPHTSQTVTKGQVPFQFFFNLPFLHLIFITITLRLKYCTSSRFKEGENYESGFNTS